MALILFVVQISPKLFCVLKTEYQISSFWERFCRFAHIIRLGNHFCLGITFTAVQAHLKKTCHGSVVFIYRYIFDVVMQSNKQTGP